MTCPSGDDRSVSRSAIFGVVRRTLFELHKHMYHQHFSVNKLFHKRTWLNIYILRLNTENYGIIPTLHHARGGKVGINIISRRYSKILRCVCVTASIYNVTHVFRLNNMKTTPIHINRW